MDQIVAEVQQVVKRLSPKGVDGSDSAGCREETHVSNQTSKIKGGP